MFLSQLPNDSYALVKSPDCWAYQMVLRRDETGKLFVFDTDIMQIVEVHWEQEKDFDGLPWIEPFKKQWKLGDPLLIMTPVEN